MKARSLLGSTAALTRRSGRTQDATTLIATDYAPGWTPGLARRGTGLRHRADALSRPLLGAPLTHAPTLGLFYPPLSPRCPEGRADFDPKVFYCTIKYKDCKYIRLLSPPYRLPNRLFSAVRWNYE